MWEQLIQAMKKGNLEQAEQLIEKLRERRYGTSNLNELDRIDEHGNTALHYANYRGEVEAYAELTFKIVDDHIEAKNNPEASLNNPKALLEALKSRVLFKSIDCKYIDSIIRNYLDPQFKEAGVEKVEKVCRLLIESTDIKHIMSLKNSSFIKRVVSKTIADFVANEFSKDKMSPPDLNSCQTSKNEMCQPDLFGCKEKFLKLYQIVDWDLIDAHISTKYYGINSSEVIKYIENYYFKLFKVYKAENEDSAILASVDSAHTPHNHPDLDETHSTPPPEHSNSVELSGEAEVINS